MTLSALSVVTLAVVVLVLQLALLVAAGVWGVRRLVGEFGPFPAPHRSPRRRDNRAPPPALALRASGA
jgi:hypothetical protein